MSLIPPDEDISFELEFWRTIEGLEGKFFDSIDNLKKSLPKDIIKVEMHNYGFAQYVAKTDDGEIPLKIAYNCKTCNGIVAGTPIIKPYNNISFLSGSKGIKYSCSKCHYLLYESIQEMS